MIPKDSQFTPDLAKGGGLAIIGVVMATVTKSMAFDITGGILSAIGILFAGITVGIKRQKVLNSFTHEVARGRKALEDDISTKLVQYVDTIERRIDQNFLEFDAMIQLEETETSQLTKNHMHIDNQLTDIEKELKNQVQLKASSE
jgi:hypothetical protein